MTVRRTTPALMGRLWKASSRRGLGILKVSAMPVAVVVGGLIVMGGSQAAFSGTTESAGNNWKAATVGLISNKATALFNVAAMKPGNVESHCITVTSASDIPTDVKMYSGGVTGTNGINPYLALTIDAGYGGTDSTTACTGFTSTAALFSGSPADFAASTGYASGLPAQNLAPGASQQYRISVTLLTTAPNSAQGGQSSVKFVWENQ